MATVFRARRVGDAVEVALKVPHPHLQRDPDFVRMFMREGLLARRLEHPRIVRTLELGQHEGLHFLVMEWVQGQSLAQLESAGARLPMEVAVRVAADLADGLHAVHELRAADGALLRAVHRDVSPQNALVDAAGGVKLIDFGISKVSTGQRQATATGFLTGKLGYMSPEQAYGRAVDRRSDLYALGVVLWELLAGRPLFRADEDLALLELVRQPSVPSLGRFVPDLPPALEAAVMQALAPDPAARPADALTWRTALLAAVPVAAAPATAASPSR